MFFSRNIVCVWCWLLSATPRVMIFFVGVCVFLLFRPWYSSVNKGKLMLALHKLHEKGNYTRNTSPLPRQNLPKTRCLLPIFMSEWEPFGGVLSRCAKQTRFRSQTDSVPAFFYRRLCRRSSIGGVVLTVILVQCRPARRKCVRKKRRLRFWKNLRKRL